MKLFEVLPSRFFQLFSGKNKEIYAEAVLLLYEHSLVERFGIRYDLMRDALQELVETQEGLGLTYEEEEEAVSPSWGAEGGDIYRQKANALLRRLQNLQWIDVETRDNFQQYIVLPHYSSRMLGLLKELCEGRAVEYQRFAFVTYQLLTGSEAQQRPSFAVLEGERLTYQFQQELITLYNNMKHHMEQVVAKDSIQDVLDHHFEEYKAKIVDASYHRLKTSDHVARYRFLILETVQKWLLDRDWFSSMVEDGLRNQFYTSREEAEQGLRGALLRMEEVYNGLDEIFYQIDVRHNQYLRASYDRARYLSQHSQGLDQQLAKLLEWTAAHWSKNQQLPQMLGGLIHLQQLAQISSRSLQSPRKKREPHEPEGHVVVPIAPELKEELRKQNLERLQKTITREKVGAFVLGRLGERTEMGMEELVPTNLEEFLFLSYIYLYGYDAKAGFTLQREKVPKIMCVDQYRFYAHRIVKNTKVKR